MSTQFTARPGKASDLRPWGKPGSKLQPSTAVPIKPMPPTIPCSEVSAYLAANPGAYYLPFVTQEGVILQDLPGRTRVLANVALPVQNPFTLPVEAATITELESNLLFFLETGRRPGLPTDPHEKAQYEEALKAMNQRLREWLGDTVTHEAPTGSSLRGKGKVTRYRESLARV